MQNHLAVRVLLLGGVEYGQVPAWAFPEAGYPQQVGEVRPLVRLAEVHEFLKGLPGVGQPVFRGTAMAVKPVFYS